MIVSKYSSSSSSCDHSNSNYIRSDVVFIQRASMNRKGGDPRVLASLGLASPIFRDFRLNRALRVCKTNTTLYKALLV
jgi:hypothetical protein